MIRRMEHEDVPRIADLERQCFSDPWSTRSIDGEVENPISLWLVWEENGEILGYIGSQRVLPEADLMNLAVAPEGRRCQIATKLCLALFEQLQGLGVNQLFLEVRASNEAAKRLYEGLGFRYVGRRPRYYVNPQEDALIMGKELGVC